MLFSSRMKADYRKSRLSVEVLYFPRDSMQSGSQGGKESIRGRSLANPLPVGRMDNDRLNLNSVLREGPRAVPSLYPPRKTILVPNDMDSPIRCGAIAWLMSV